METVLSKQLLILALVDTLHKNNYCSKTWGGLGSVCTTLEPVRSTSNDIRQISVLQKDLAPHEKKDFGFSEFQTFLAKN